MTNVNIWRNFMTYICNGESHTTINRLMHTAQQNNDFDSHNKWKCVALDSTFMDMDMHLHFCRLYSFPDSIIFGNSHYFINSLIFFGEQWPMCHCLQYCRERQTPNGRNEWTINECITSSIFLAERKTEKTDDGWEVGGFEEYFMHKSIAAIT